MDGELIVDDGSTELVVRLGRAWYIYSLTLGKST